MSEQTKPREWWIVTGFYHNDSVRHGPFPDGGYDFPWTHVIEKKAFDAQALEIEKLKLENKEMRFELEAKQRPLSEQVFELTIERDRLQAENERLEMQKFNLEADYQRAMETLRQQLNRLAQANEILRAKVLEHKEAYSTDIFPNSEKLDDNSTRDSISARMGRHMCDCFLKYMDEALAEDAKLESESGE